MKKIILMFVSFLLLLPAVGFAAEASISELAGALAERLISGDYSKYFVIGAIAEIALVALRRNLIYVDKLKGKKKLYVIAGLTAVITYVTQKDLGAPLDSAFWQDFAVSLMALVTGHQALKHKAVGVGLPADKKKK